MGISLFPIKARGDNVISAIGSKPSISHGIGRTEIGTTIEATELAYFLYLLWEFHQER